MFPQIFRSSAVVSILRAELLFKLLPSKRVLKGCAFNVSNVTMNIRKLRKKCKHTKVKILNKICEFSSWLLICSFQKEGWIPFILCTQKLEVKFEIFFVKLKVTVERRPFPGLFSFSVFVSRRRSIEKRGARGKLGLYRL